MTSSITTVLPALHMGQLHPYENYLVLAIAFGPFLVLAVVVYFVRRRDLSDEDPSAEPEHGQGQGQDDETEVSPSRPPTT